MPSSTPSRPRDNMQVWVLGASMGGPQAIKRFLAKMPGGLPVCFILAQHIYSKDLPILASQLDRCSAYRVVPLKDGTVLEPGTLVLAPVDKQIKFSPHGIITLHPSIGSSYYHPSIDGVITCVAEHYRDRCGAIIFSGMGNDGIKGCEYLHARNGLVWAQSKQSCVISSMPESARETGTVSFSGNPEQLAAQLSSHLEHWLRARALQSVNSGAASSTQTGTSGA
ncbi:MAG: chemotaxis protein CheB [Pseudomonadota bacterium]